MMRFSYAFGACLTLCAVVACGGGTTSDDGSGGQGSGGAAAVAGYSSAESDCAGCEYVARGFQKVEALLLDEDGLLVLDDGARTVYRQPLPGERTALATGVSGIWMWQDADAVYVEGNDPTLDLHVARRVPKRGGDAVEIARFDWDSGYTLDVDATRCLRFTGDAGEIAATSGTTSTVLRTFAADDPDRPASGSLAIDAAGQLIWSTRTNDLWVARSIEDPGARVPEIGAAAVKRLDQHVYVMTFDPALAASDAPKGLHRVEVGGSLTRVLPESDGDITRSWAIGASGVFGVVSGDGPLVYTDSTTGHVTTLLELSELPASIGMRAMAVHEGYLYFAATGLGGGDGRIYRMPVPE